MVPVLRAALQTQKGEARGTHNSRPSWQSLPTGDPFENRAPSHPGYFFLVFDLFPVMPRFLLAVGLLVYSSLLQLPPALSFFFLHFFFFPCLVESLQLLIVLPYCGAPMLGVLRPVRAPSAF